MRTLIFSKQPEEITPLLEAKGCMIVTDTPELIVTWGGDGTLLLAEHKFPGIPKLALGKSKTCKKCIHPNPEQAIASIDLNNLIIKEHPKLHATINGTELPLALNDVVIRNTDQMHAIRFTVNGQEEHIGDGIVASTPFGSTAYFQSICRQTFSEGLGIAFNNTMQEQAPLIGTEPVTIKITRGDATVSIDTLTETWTLHTGDIVQLSLADDVAKIVVLE